MFFEDENVEAPPRQHQRRNEAVVPGADDYDIGR
jgi:hypothetical protein